VAVLVLWATLAQCTLVGLSERIHQAHCNDNVDCEVLNDHTDPSFDFCHPYQCNAVHVCERSILDQDSDGYISERCEPDAARRDCNDTRPEAHPGGQERCNGLDDDCDSRMDEGLFEQDTGYVLDFGASEPVTTLSFAADPQKPRLAAGYLTSDGVIAVTEVEATNANSVNPTAVRIPMHFDVAPRPLSFAVGHLPDSPFALAAYVMDRVPRVLVGSVYWPDTTLQLTTLIESDGLHCAADESCAAANSGAVIPESSSFTVASGYAGTLVVYVRGPAQQADACYSGSTAPAPRALLANMLGDDPGHLSEVANTAAVIARVRDPNSVAVLGLPRGRTTERHGFLVAYIDDDGAVVFRQVRLHDGALLVSAALLTVPAPGDAFRSPQLALGDYGTRGATFALVAAHGCGDDARVIAAQLSLQLVEDGTVTLRAEGDLVEVAESDGQRQPALIWNAMSGLWAVAFRDEQGIRARILNDAFQLTGSDALILDRTTPLGDPHADRVAVVTQASSANLFAVFHQALNVNAHYGLNRSTIDGCKR
jgi:hypothetical protein